MTGAAVAAVGAADARFVVEFQVAGGAWQREPLSSCCSVRFEDALPVRSVNALWGTGGLVWVLVTAAAYLAAGILAFRLCERAAKVRGSLARY